MTRLALILGTGMWLSAPVCAQRPALPPVNRLAPFVPSPQNVVEKMLEAADVKPGETVFDLGSGDGRVLITAAQLFGANAVGIEISPKAVAASREKIRKLQLEKQCSVMEGDILETDLSRADVVTLYLLTASNDQLRPKLEKYLRPGARVVSHDYEIPGWTPARVDRVEAHKRQHLLYVYQIPAKKK